MGNTIGTEFGWCTVSSFRKEKCKIRGISDGRAFISSVSGSGHDWITELAK